MKRFITLILMLLSMPLWAHSRLSQTFNAGFLHPLTGLDHLLMLLAVGFYATCTPQRPCAVALVVADAGFGCFIGAPWFLWWGGNGHCLVVVGHGCHVAQTDAFAVAQCIAYRCGRGVSRFCPWFGNGRFFGLCWFFCQQYQSVIAGFSDRSLLGAPHDTTPFWRYFIDPRFMAVVGRLVLQRP